MTNPRSSLLCALFSSVLFSAAVAEAQGVWTRAAKGPGARTQTAMAYDTLRQRSVLFGGLDTNGRLDDTWEFDGTKWTLLKPGTKPPARNGHRMAYHEKRGVVLMFGGFDGKKPLDDSWEFDGKDWRRCTCAGPSARSFFGMTYDASREVIVLFGGWDHKNAVGGTFEWNGSWAKRNLATNPPAVTAPVLTFDPPSGAVILAGGWNGGFRAETWLLDRQGWRKTAAVAPAFADVTAVFHPKRGRVVSFGGTSGAGRGWNVTHEWDGSRWLLMPTNGTPPGRSHYAATYDVARGRIVMFGGEDWRVVPYDDTWTYADTVRATYTPFGVGCKDHNGRVPGLRAVLGTRPWVGSQLVVQAENLDKGFGTALLSLGFSIRQWGSLSLPRSLAPFGMQGCTLYVSPDLMLPAPTRNGLAQWILPIPNDLNLMGLSFHNQAFIVAPRANVLGMVASNAATGVLGRR